MVSLYSLIYLKYKIFYNIKIVAFNFQPGETKGSCPAFFCMDLGFWLNICQVMFNQWKYTFRL